MEGPPHVGARRFGGSQGLACSKLGGEAGDIRQGMQRPKCDGSTGPHGRVGHEGSPHLIILPDLEDLACHAHEKLPTDILAFFGDVAVTGWVEAGCLGKAMVCE